MGQVVSLGGMVIQHILSCFIKKMSTFLALFGYLLPSITSLLKGNTMVQVVEDHIWNKQDVLKLLKDNLVMAQNRMKQAADQHRTEREFEAGDWAFLRLQQYKQMPLQ
jgi:hypothetical protein